MCAQLTQQGQARKRRRQAVVCTECRRRKIACDRNSPCAQCIQSSSVCTYYNSCNSFGLKNDFMGSQDGSMNGHTISSFGGTQGTYAFETRPQISLPWNFQNSFHGAAEVGIPSTAAALVDLGMAHSFDTRELGSLSLPLNMPISTAHMPSSDVSPTGVMALDPPAGITDQPSVEIIQQADAPFEEPSHVVFHKSRFYPPSHWVTLSRRVRYLFLF